MLRTLHSYARGLGCAMVMVTAVSAQTVTTRTVARGVTIFLFDDEQLVRLGLVADGFGVNEEFGQAVPNFVFEAETTPAAIRSAQGITTGTIVAFNHTGSVALVGRQATLIVSNPQIRRATRDQTADYFIVSGGRAVFEVYDTITTTGEDDDSFTLISNDVRFTSYATEVLGLGSTTDESVLTLVVRLHIERMDPSSTPSHSLATNEESGSIAGSIGADVIVGDLAGVWNYGTAGGISAFAIGTNSCNIGDASASWISSTAEHPVIAQNIFRLKDDRFEQIGMSWLKHGFAVDSRSLCDKCSVPSTTKLNPGCSDLYTASLNGNQAFLGPRWEVNPFSGEFLFPPTRPELETFLDRRIQVANDDIDPAQNVGAKYFGEGQYVHPDDAAAGNGENTSSYRPMSFSGPDTGGMFRGGLTGSTQRELPAIRAWAAQDPEVVETDIRVPDEGLFILAAKVWSLGNGLWHYEYAVQNINSDRAGGFFRVPLPLGISIDNVGFHDINYHSGEPQDGTDWAGMVSGGSIVWTTESVEDNANANALRWGTLYNFRFDANVGPDTTTITLGLFKLGEPFAIGAESIGPASGIIDCNGNSLPDGCDISCEAVNCAEPCGTSIDCNDNSVPDECEPDCNKNGIADACDLANGSPDCDENRVPDECQPDCDGDGIPDVCEGIEDCDGDRVEDCVDVCPNTPLDNPSASCVCPEFDTCCWTTPLPFCVDNFPRGNCFVDGGTPDCFLLPCVDGCLTGDFDLNDDINLFDVARMMSCYGGPLEGIGTVDPSAECLLRFDFDRDDDVDEADYALFRGTLTGVRDPADKLCEPNPPCPPLDVVFIMDTSASMADEVDALCQGIETLISDLAAQQIEVNASILEISTGQISIPCVNGSVVSDLGSDVPGDLATCPFPDGDAPFESWGPAIAIVAERFAWTTGATRLIIPISDEGPCNGNSPGGCADPGDDRDAIINAAAVANLHGVVVSPITASGSDECVWKLAEDLATLTGGTTSHSENAAADLLLKASGIVSDACANAN